MEKLEENNNTIIMNLSEQVQNLQSQVKQLSSRLDTLEKGKPAVLPQAHQQAATVVEQRPQPQPVQEAQESPPALFDTSALLPRISTICFLMVVALILRTITDNELINTQAGSILGMAYAGILILLGWRLYAKNSRLAPVFPGCGILLLFSIVLETHEHYKSLSTNGAYAILFLAGLVVFVMSIRFKASKLIGLGVTGTAAVAMAIDFPYPNYVILGLLLLSAIIASSYAYKQLTCRYLRWVLLFLSGIFWLLWTLKMNTLATNADKVAESMSPDWFIPMLFTFWGVYLITVVLNVLKKDLQLGFFESIIPTLTAAGAFGAGYVALNSWFKQDMWFYVLMVVIATLHLGLAWWLARRDKENAAGVNVFILAGACLIVLTSATVIKHVGYILPIWSISALGLAYISTHLHNEGVRVTSYLLQVTACIAAIFSGAALVPSVAPAATGLATFALCVFSIIQYKWSRTNAPEKDRSFYFSKLDKQNYSAVVLLITGLLGGYYFSQFIIHQGLANITADYIPLFKSGQSLVINIGAILLMSIALKSRNKEIVLIGAMVALIGAGKVFIFDLFGIKGVPLILSVLSTGVVAAFGSVVMGRWQKKVTETAV